MIDKQTFGIYEAINYGDALDGTLREIQRLSKMCDELRQQLTVANSELNRVSEELGLPAGIGPAPGELRRILESLRQQLADVIQTSFELCPECGWRTLIPEEGCIKCERVESVAEQREAAAELGVALAASRKLVAGLRKENEKLERQLAAALDSCRPLGTGRFG